MILLLLLISAPPRVGQIQPDVRMGTGMWMTGGGFTGSTVRYDNTVTVTKDNLESEVRAALAGPVVDWTKQGQDLKLETYTDQVAWCNPVCEQIGAYCVPFCVRGRDGTSRTYRINEPRIYGIAGSDRTKLNKGAMVPIVGRHLSATKAKPSVWIVDDSGNIQRLGLVNPGGRGTGNVVDIDRCVLWASIPATVREGDYSLFIFTGENRWGISNLIPITIVPQTPQNVVSVQVSSGTTIDGIVTAAKDLSVLSLPPGKLLLTKTTDIGSSVTIQGSGKTLTVLAGSPDFVADKSKLVGSRDSMLRLTGSNITFKDLTIELTPGTTRSAIAAGPGVDSVTFENCRFVSNTPAVNKDGYCDGYFYRWGLHRYWRFENCEFRCQMPFEGTNGPLNGFRTNGSNDNLLIVGGSFIPPFGRLSGSLLGSCLGRSSLIYGMDVSGSRRGLALAAGDGTIESVVACCNFSDMLSELGNGETILHEARGSCVGYVNSADNMTFATFGNDTQDRTRWTACIISGKGFGQYRVIASSKDGTHTLETPWEIPPDQSSCVLISQCPTDCSFVFNRFQGCVGGINLYGNSFGNVINSNWFRGSHEGILCNTNWNSAGTSGVGGHSGDGRSIAWWSSFRGNVFEGSTAYHFIAPRTSIDLGIYKHPQIAFLSTAFTTTFGDVTNQLRAMEGQDTENSSPAQTTTLKFPLIDYVSSTYDVGYSGKSKYHAPVIDRRPQQPFWYRTASGIGNVRIGGTKWDDVPVAPDKCMQVGP